MRESVCELLCGDHIVNVVAVDRYVQNTKSMKSEVLNTKHPLTSAQAAFTLYFAAILWSFW